jgi:hypothetical protein
MEKILITPSFEFLVASVSLFFDPTLPTSLNIGPKHVFSWATAMVVTDA